METLFHVVIKDPPTNMVFPNKKGKLDKDGVLKADKVIYLTANVFYDGTHWAIKSKVVNYAKDWIIWFLVKMPKIQKCQLEITYHHHTDTFDLDNKVYFWTKIILDLMKTPTSKQILKAREYNNEIKTLNVLQEDTVRFVDGINMKYKKGESAIELKIIGTLKEEQGSLFN